MKFPKTGCEPCRNSGEQQPMTPDEMKQAYEQWQKAKQASGEPPAEAAKPEPANGNAIEIEDARETFRLPDGTLFSLEPYAFCNEVEAIEARLGAANRDARYAYQDALNEAAAKGEKPESVPLPHQFTTHDVWDEVIRLITEENPGVVLSRGQAEKITAKVQEIYLQKKSATRSNIRRLQDSLNSMG